MLYFGYCGVIASVLSSHYILTSMQKCTYLSPALLGAALIVFYMYVRVDMQVWNVCCDCLD